MKKTITLILAICFACAVIAPLPSAASEFGGMSDNEISAKLDDDSLEYDDDILIVVLKHEYSSNDKIFTTDDFPEVDIASVEDISRITDPDVYEEVKHRYKTILEFKLNRSGHDDLATAMKELSKRPEIESVGPNYYLDIEETAEPNDAYYGEQWNLKKISAPAAWDNYTKGNKSVRVGVIDGGIDYNHPDLRYNIVNNNIDMPFNKKDDDGNGYIDDYHGYNFDKKISDPRPDAGDDHGTKCAGIIGAVANNNIGISGVCWDTSIVALRALDKTKNMADAINYANNNKIPIISFSMTIGSGFSKELYTAIGNYYGLFVCTAGNDKLDRDKNPAYPAYFGYDNMIVVAASDENDKLASFSGYGAKSVHLAAPGTNIKTLTLGDTYTPGGGMNGTSAAVPHVAGVAALIKTYNNKYTTSQIKRSIINGVDKIPALNGKVSSGGRLNANAALKYASMLSTDSASLLPVLTSSGIGGIWYQNVYDDFTK